MVPEPLILGQFRILQPRELPASSNSGEELHPGGGSVGGKRNSMDVDVGMGQGGQPSPEVLYSDKICEGLLGTDVPSRLTQNLGCPEHRLGQDPFPKVTRRSFQSLCSVPALYWHLLGSPKAVLLRLQMGRLRHKQAAPHQGREAVSCLRFQDRTPKLSL